jgi:Ran GTPase-activating protein (RanGAP) involved in mRNA processing and transport
MLTALTQVSSNKMFIWRGVKEDLSDKYEVGKEYVWWAFSSCTEQLVVLESEFFLGKSGERTLFNISCDNGKKIASYSYISAENEVILPSATQFLVKSKRIHHLVFIVFNYKKFHQFNVTDPDVSLIIKEAINGKKCSLLDLNHNIITAEGARLIANVLNQNNSLKILRFWHNHLLDAGANYITEALCSNNALTFLCLTDACASNIARMLKENRTLNIFYLNNNGIGDEGMKLLMNSLCYNETLTQLYLHNNAITNQSNNSIEKVFNHNHTLQLLTLGDNQFSEQGKTYLRNLAREKGNFKFYV